MERYLKSRLPMIWRLLRDNSGSMAIFGSFVIIITLMVVAVAFEASNLYIARLQAQRSADVAALAAANTANPINNGLPSQTAIATAKQVALMNGLDDLNISVVRGENGEQMIATTATNPVTLTIGKLLTSSETVNVSASAAAFSSKATNMTPKGDCIRSLLGPVNIYNNAVIDGAKCTIASATFFFACDNANIRAATVETGYPEGSEGPYICPKARLTPAFPNFGFEKKSVDPLADDARTAAIWNRLKGMTSWSYGTAIPVKPLPVSVPYGSSASYSSTTSSLGKERAWGTLTISDSSLKLTSSGAPDHNCINPLTISGNILLQGTSKLVLGSGCYEVAGYLVAGDGAAITIAPAPGADVTLAMAQYIKNGNGSLAFGDMRVSIQGSILNQTGGTLTFGSGPFMIGGSLANTSGTLKLGSGPYYFAGGTVTNGTGLMSFAGGTFYLWGGSLANQSTGTITFGDGPFLFYGGTVTNVSGTMRFGNGNFEFSGGSLALNPGSETAFGRGDMNMYGGTVYFHGDRLTFGGDGDPAQGSSSAFFYGGSFSMKSKYLKAIGTTFAFYGGSVSLYGVGEMNMTAPRDNNPVYGYRDILFYIYGGAFSLYQNGAQDMLSGIIYAPRTNISIYGSQTVKLPENGCFQVIGGVVDLYQSMSSAFAPCGDGSQTGTGRAVPLLTR